MTGLISNEGMEDVRVVKNHSYKALPKLLSELMRPYRKWLLLFSLRWSLKR